MTKLLKKYASARKVSAAVGVLAQAVASGIFHGKALAVASGVILIATGLGIYHTPNAPNPQ